MESGFELIAVGPIMRGADTLTVLDEYRANGVVKPGDIVAFKRAGSLLCWSVDLLAYNKLRGLLENCLKTAELSMEQNCNQIDGIINNEAPKPSLQECLKQCQREAADRSQGNASPGRRSPRKER